MNKNRIRIFDTTLRDGEQSPGASMNTQDKVEIARQLVKLGVDVIEGGFPITSPGDLEAVQRIAREVKGVTVAGLARAVAKDIAAAAEGVADAEDPLIHVFLATSEIHRKYKLRKAQAEIIRLAVEGVQQARKHVAKVEFSPEDASRTEPEFLADVVRETIAAGATTVNIPDTVGYALPGPFGDLIGMLFDTVPNIGDAVISVHCHNDLGLAVANSLAAVKAGARQVECTINGLGERAGNAALEEIVMALKTRRDYLGCTCGIKTRHIMATSRMVSRITGIHVQRNKAIVGENAFAHEAGVHQDGVLKNRKTYEIMTPADVGLTANKLVLGKHSGRHALRERAKALGFTLSGEQLDDAFDRFKELADKKKEIYDEDLAALMEDLTAEVPQVFALVDFHTSSGNTITPTATVCLLKDDGTKAEDASCGDGPIDALCKAMDRITGMHAKLLEYELRALTAGKDAQGEVQVCVEAKGEVARGRSVSTDIVEASARAYLNAINRIAARLKRPAEKQK